MSDIVIHPTYLVNLSASSNAAGLTLEQFDMGDLYGSTMTSWFDVAATLYKAQAEVPRRWDYSPGALSLSDVPDDWSLEAMLTEMLKAGETSVEDLIALGDELMAFRDELEQAGLSY